MQKFLSVTQFADELGITVACVRRWVLMRKIETVRVGRLVRVPLAELDRILREGTIPARAHKGGSRGE